MATFKLVVEESKKGDIIQEATIEKTEVKVCADREEILHHF